MTLRPVFFLGFNANSPDPGLFWMAFKGACREGSGLGSGLTPVGVWIEGTQHFRPQAICFPKRGLKPLGLLRGFLGAVLSTLGVSTISPLPNANLLLSFQVFWKILFSV